MVISERERAEKDIKKLEKAMAEFVKLKLNEKFPKVYEWAGNYAKDSKHFYKKGDYFTAFGCANYAYGIIDGILIAENKK